MSAPAIRTRDVRFTYKPSGLASRRAVEALRGVSFEVRPGEVYGLLGPNGAGKTTLIKTVATLILPDSGEVEVLGERLPGGEARIRPRLGIALAEYERTFHLRLNGEQNLAFFASFLDIPRREVRARVAETLEQVGLAEAGRKMVIEYSSGMKHRLAVARALLPRPDLLILDEPTAGLDVQSSRALGDLILKLAREEGASVLYTTHRLEEAGRLCDRIGIMRRGELVAEETPAALRRLAGGTTVLEVTLDRVDEALAAACAVLPHARSAFAEGSSTLRVHVDSVEPMLAPLLELLGKEGRRVRGVRTHEPTVEDAYLALTKEEGSVAR